MSTLIEDTTGQMAKMLLEGWTLSAETCPTQGCNVPLLTKTGSSYCAKCSKGDETTLEVAADSETSSASALSVSTPPTPSVNLPNEPLPARTPDVQRDAAAREIGELLLKGWCLLGDECPRCPGIPLMSRPRPRPSSAGEASSSRSASVTEGRPPGKVCVNCRAEYLPPGAQEQPAAAFVPTGGAAARKRARIAEDQAARRQAPPAPAARARSLESTVRALDEPAPKASTSEPIVALENALARLTEELGQATQSRPLNVAAIGDLSDAIGKTARAIQDVRGLL